jgi:hypothetical protein
MAALRTQIYLTREQRTALDELADADGASLAELIRDAVDEYLRTRPADPDSALDASFGAVPDAAAVPRSDWDEREQRLSVG